ncbi:MAG: hypothetical protein ABIO46_04140 [Chitinophagales bacterium]
MRSTISKRLRMMVVMVSFPFLLLHAQPIRITATLDSTNYLIGDWIRIQISAAHSGNTKMLWNYPQMIRSENFEKLSESAIDSIQQKDFLTENKIITVTTFDTGVLSIPPIICYFQQNGSTDSAITAALSVYVSTVKTDTSAAARSIKPPFEIPVPGRSVWWYVIPLVSFVIIALAGWYFLVEKRSRRKLIITKPGDLRLPHEKAFDSIRELEELKPWEQNQVKDYYVKITQVLREYIETGLDLPALENTTQEIIASLQSRSLDKGLLQQLNYDLSMADLVKFAKEQPTAPDHLQILKTVKEFVEKTHPSIQLPVQEGSPA